MDAVTELVEALESGRYRADGDWMRPSDAQDGVPWSDLAEEQKYGVLMSEMLWSGFEVDQIADVSRRVVDGESPEFWMDGIAASDQAEHDAKVFAEWREDEQAARVRDFGEAGTAAYGAPVAERAEPIESARPYIEPQTAAEVAEEERLHAAEHFQKSQREYFADDPFYDGIMREMDAAQVADDDGTPYIPHAALDAIDRSVAEYEADKAARADAISAPAEGRSSDEIDPRFLNEDGSASDRVTTAFVEWEIGKIRDRYFDDSADPPKDEWPSVPEIEKLRLIDQGTSINELSDEDALAVAGRHMNLDLLSGQHEAGLVNLRASIEQLDRDFEETTREIEEFNASLEGTKKLFDHFERFQAVADDPAAARDFLLAETYELSREIGFVGFREEYMDDPDAIKEWPDPDARVKGLREFWDGQADFDRYRQSHADVDIATLIEHRDHLIVLRDGPEQAQAEYYSRTGDLSRQARHPVAANDNYPGGDGPPDGPPPSDYDRLLEDAFERGKHRQQEPEKGRSR